MTICDALNLVDDLKPNNIDRARKIGWLNDLDKQVFDEIISRHERDASNPETFAGYTEATDEDTNLLIPDPYSEVYRWFLEMQIDLANMEMKKYNNSAVLFDNAWKKYAGMYHRKHMPICNANFKY